jgi:hypothetical protein
MEATFPVGPWEVPDVLDDCFPSQAEMPTVGNAKTMVSVSIEDLLKVWATDKPNVLNIGNLVFVKGSGVGASAKTGENIDRIIVFQEPGPSLQPQGLQPQGLQPQGLQPQGLQPQGNKTLADAKGEANGNKTLADAKAEANDQKRPHDGYLVGSRGTIYYVNRFVYDGEISNLHPHGQGRLKQLMGNNVTRVSTGCFAIGRADGYCVTVDSDGETSRGLHSNGRLKEGWVNLGRMDDSRDPVDTLGIHSLRRCKAQLNKGFSLDGEGIVETSTYRHEGRYHNSLREGEGISYVWHNYQKAYIVTKGMWVFDRLDGWARSWILPIVDPGDAAAARLYMKTFPDPPPRFFLTGVDQGDDMAKVLRPCIDILALASSSSPSGAALPNISVAYAALERFATNHGNFSRLSGNCSWKRSALLEAIGGFLNTSDRRNPIIVWLAHGQIDSGNWLSDDVECVTLCDIVKVWKDSKCFKSYEVSELTIVSFGCHSGAWVEAARTMSPPRVSIQTWSAPNGQFVWPSSVLQDWLQLFTAPIGSSRSFPLVSGGYPMAYTATPVMQRLVPLVNGMRILETGAHKEGQIAFPPIITKPLNGDAPMKQSSQEKETPTPDLERGHGKEQQKETSLPLPVIEQKGNEREKRKETEPPTAVSLQQTERKLATLAPQETTAVAKKMTNPIGSTLEIAKANQPLKLMDAALPNPLNPKL